MVEQMYREQENNHLEWPDRTVPNILVPKSKLYSIYILACQEIEKV